jgi:transcriptional regulator with PAS, ATPase and Fis domain
VARKREDIVRIESLAAQGYGPYAGPLGLAGTSPALLAMCARIESLAWSSAPVLIQGETGSGKELVARALHARSPREAAPFVPHNFAAIPDSLVESELFGHVRGAFTGAHADRPGLFELASGGTLFLDEIGDASAPVQSRLLRALQEGEVRRLGEGRARRVDVRVVAATHRNLPGLVRAGRFREDLYYRLHVLSLRVPPLRERREDIPLLLAHAVERLGRRERRRVWGIRRGALAALGAHEWPGNVRQLEGALLRAVHAPGHEGVIEREGLGEDFLDAGADRVGEERADLRGRTRAYEAALIASALSAHDGNRTRAARALGLTRQGLWKKLRRLRAAADATPSSTE